MRRGYSVPFRVMRPRGEFAFSFRSPCTTSLTPSPRDSRRTGSIWTLTSRLAPPTISTLPTPATLSKSFPDPFIRKRGQLALGKGIGLDRQRCCRQSIKIQFLDDRVFDTIRQLIANLADLGPGLLSDLIDPLFQTKLHHDGRDTFRANKN